MATGALEEMERPTHPWVRAYVEGRAPTPLLLRWFCANSTHFSRLQKDSCSLHKNRSCRAHRGSDPANSEAVTASETFSPRSRWIDGLPHGNPRQWILPGARRTAPTLEMMIPL